VTEGDRVPASEEFDVAAGPTISFGFNLGKIPDQGEDSDPILRDGPDLGLVGVFDGMGGAGGTIYETPDGRRSGAYLASRIARDVVERRMVDLLEPDWNLKGETAAEDLRRSVQDALQERLAELKAPPSQLRSRLLRALPTTMAVVALQRTHRDRSRWTCHVFWAGDSRAYAFLPTGLRQLSTDDLRDPSDAMTNLYRDSVVSNAMSADTEFHVNYRRVELKAPFLVCCATDGCFGYVPSPMHFEQLVLASLQESRSVDAWSRSIQAQVSAVTGDDAAMAMMSIGADLPELQSLYAPRVAELEEHYIGPLDESRHAVAEAEQALAAARQRHSDLTGERWAAYQADYERHLKPEPPVEDEQAEEQQGHEDQAGEEQAVEESEAAEEKVTS
jgi:serine/threonine protein phosphatase PrpC